MFSNVYRISGPTVSPSISTTPTGQVTVTAFQGELPNYTAFLNTGPTLIAVTIASGQPQAPTPAFPVPGATTAPVFVLAPNMTLPFVIATPSTPFNFNALTNSSVAPTLFVTPVTGV